MEQPNENIRFTGWLLISFVDKALLIGNCHLFAPLNLFAGRVFCLAHAFVPFSFQLLNSAINLIRRQQTLTESTKVIHVQLKLEMFFNFLKTRKLKGLRAGLKMHIISYSLQGDVLFRNSGEENRKKFTLQKVPEYQYWADRYIEF